MGAERHECIGIIGLGAMGLAVASRMVSCRLSVVGCDIDASRVRLAADLGVTIAEHPQHVAHLASRIICFVDTGPQVEDVLMGPAGLRTELGRGDCVLCMSTVDLPVIEVCSRAIGEAGAYFLDALVSGAPAAAAAGKLAIYVGGEPAGFQAAEVIWKSLAASAYHAGPVGAGFAMKMINNILFHVSSVAIIEALILGAKAGLEPDVMAKALTGGSGDSVALKVRGSRMLSGDFAGIPMRVAYRELLMETDFGRKHKSPLLLASVAEQVYAMGMARGLGEEDGAALVKVYEDLVSVSLSVTSWT
jgi:3-hydroxyisobutyrate dehydrogenase-like beta-hydroxyacid dehydrogenase